MTGTHESRQIFLHGPAGKLEAVLWVPSGRTPTLAAVVCHPHPLFGGTLHNKVVYQTAKTLDGLGVPVLRFNFRGTGRSEGTHDKGMGERDDVRAALDFVTKEFPGIPLLVAGFSFGCWVGLQVGCADERVASVIGLGTPVNSTDFSFLRGCEKPKLFVHGSKDQFGDTAKLRGLIDSLPGKKRLVVVADADHFFVGKLDQASAAIADWMKELYPNLVS